jgi:hypothetical protein
VHAKLLRERLGSDDCPCTLVSRLQSRNQARAYVKTAARDRVADEGRRVIETARRIMLGDVKA